jgi:hypothetical protein
MAMVSRMFYIHSETIPIGMARTTTCAPAAAKLQSGKWKSTDLPEIFQYSKTRLDEENNDRSRKADLRGNKIIALILLRQLLLIILK